MLLRNLFLIVTTYMAIMLPVLAEAANLANRLNTSQNTEAQFYLKEVYYFGETQDYDIDPVEEDNRAAFKWYKKVAEQGDVLAQFTLGFMHENGIGTKYDNEEAIKWYTKAAEQGHALAQYNLGMIYYYAYRRTRSWSQKTADFFRELIPWGNKTEDEARLTQAENLVLAYMWINVATRSGIETYIEKRDELLEKMTPELIQAGDRLTRKCITKNYKKCRPTRRER